MTGTITRRQWIGASVVLAASMLSSGVVQAADDGKLRTIRVGTMSGPDAEIWKVVAQQARAEGLDVKVTEFNDYVQPNAALDAGDLDANGFQHQPFLDSQIRQRGYKIVSIGLTYTAPLGFYSKKIKSLKDLPENASIGIQNDPSNGNRALLLLQANHVIKLKPGAGVDGRNATPLDVIENPKHIKLVELDAAQLPRSLDDLSSASINTDYAVKAGLSPAKDAIAREDVRGPYANLVAVRTQDADKPWARQLIKAYHTQQVRDFINQRFNGSIIPAF